MAIDNISRTSLSIPLMSSRPPSMFMRIPIVLLDLIVSYDYVLFTHCDIIIDRCGAFICQYKESEKL